MSPPLHCRSSYSCRYFVLPCCFFDFYGKYQRRQCKKSQYKEYIDFIAEVSQVSGFNTEEDCLRIPSTKRVGSRSPDSELCPRSANEKIGRTPFEIQSYTWPSGSVVELILVGGPLLLLSSSLPVFPVHLFTPKFCIAVLYLCWDRHN